MLNKKFLGREQGAGRPVADSDEDNDEGEEVAEAAGEAEAEEVCEVVEDDVEHDVEEESDNDEEEVVDIVGVDIVECPVLVGLSVPPHPHGVDHVHGSDSHPLGMLSVCDR